MVATNITVSTTNIGSYDPLKLGSNNKKLGVNLSIWRFDCYPYEWISPKLLLKFRGLDLPKIYVVLSCVSHSAKPTPTVCTREKLTTSSWILRPHCQKLLWRIVTRHGWNSGCWMLHHWKWYFDMQGPCEWFVKTVKRTSDFASFVVVQRHWSCLLKLTATYAQGTRV